MATSTDDLLLVLAKTYQERLVDRIISRSSKATNGCIEWTGELCTNGYPRIDVYANGVLRHPLVHRLVFALLNGLIGDRFIMHSCDNRKCIRPDHLLAGSHSENMADMVKKGRQCHGSKNASSKLTIDAVREIRLLHSTGNISQRQLSKQFGVAPMTICQVVNKKSWRYVAAKLGAM